MIIPKFKPSEYQRIVDGWIADHRRPHRKFYLLKATHRLQGRWQRFCVGKRFIGFWLKGEGWRLIALKMQVRFPVTMIGVPDACVEKIQEIK